jgi:outer membrane protein
MRTQYILLFPTFFALSFGKLHAQTTPGQVAAGQDKQPVIGTSLSLQQAVDIAIRNNLLVNQNDITMQKDKVNLNQAWDFMLPTLNANGTQQLGFGRSLNTTTYQYTTQQVTTGSYGISTNLSLFQGFTVLNNIRQNRYVYQAGQLDLEQQKDNITLSVILGYLQILSAQDVLAIAHEQSEVDRQQVERLELQNQAGGLLQLNSLTDLKGQFAQDQVNIAVDSNSLEAAKVNLFNFMNIPYKRDLLYDRNAFPLQLGDYPANPDSIYRIALAAMPMIRSSELSIKAFDRALAVQRGNYLPSLTFYSSVNSGYSNAAPEKFKVQVDNNRYTYLGLSLNVPILNYLRVRNNVRIAKLNLKNAEVLSNNTKLVLQQSVELAFQSMMAAYKQYKFYIDEAAAFAESFRINEIKFNEGVVTSDIYLLAKNKSDAANTNLAAAKYTYIFRTKVLDYYQGKLTW